MASSLVGKQAVVVGAGMGGLAATGAIAQHFEQVVVVERDALPAEPTHRPGIPQGRHVHGLLVSGQRALDTLFPGFEQDLVRAGAVPVIAGLDIRWDARLRSIPATRPRLLLIRPVASAIEHALRQRVEGSRTSSSASAAGSWNFWRRRMAAVTGVRCENSDGSKRSSRSSSTPQAWRSHAPC
jgi:2-polyprenyl-6-methoxyphenol hydroxylase-like FAD-dependent oxidoreductase